MTTNNENFDEEAFYEWITEQAHNWWNERLDDSDKEEIIVDSFINAMGEEDLKIEYLEEIEEYEETLKELNEDSNEDNNEDNPYNASNAPEYCCYCGEEFVPIEKDSVICSKCKHNSTRTQE